LSVIRGHDKLTATMYAVLVVKTEREKKREWERERVRESVRASKSEREGD